MKEVYCYSLDQENFKSAQCDSRKGAVEAFLQVHAPEIGTKFYTGVLVGIVPVIDAAACLSQIREAAVEQCDESARNWLGNITSAEVQLLNRDLNLVLHSWLRSQALWPEFGYVENVMEHTVQARIYDVHAEAKLVGLNGEPLQIEPPRREDAKGEAGSQEARKGEQP